MPPRAAAGLIVVLAGFLLCTRPDPASPAAPPARDAQKVAAEAGRELDSLKKRKDLLELQKQINALENELGVRKTDFRSSPNFTALLGALSGFVALILLLSIIPEKLTDFAKTILRVDRKDTLAELFAWNSYDKIIAETDATKLKAVYQTLYGVVGDNVSRVWRVNRRLQQWAVNSLCVGLVPSEQKPQSRKATPEESEKELIDIREKIIRLDLRMVDLEGRRVIWIRFWTAVFGVIVAAALGINAFVLLDPIMPGGLNVLLEATLFKFPLFVRGWPISAGILLTGLGAGMGSSFWHDFLDRLTSAKEKAAKLK